jgi:hypothetical protein
LRISQSDGTLTRVSFLCGAPYGAQPALENWRRYGK